MKKALITTGALLGVALLTASCTKKNLDRFNPEKHDKIDRYMDLSRNDYKQIAEPKRDANGEIIPEISYSNSGPPIPEIAPIIASPRPPKIAESQMVSIAVTDDVPLKDVLLELAKLADIDIEMDSNIEGGVNFIAKEKPFNEVIDRLSSLANLRYTMKGGVLRVERDLPYIKSYSLDFLNMDRSSESTVNVSTNVLSGSGGGSSGGGGGDSGGGDSGSSGGGGGGLNTGSTSSVTSSAESDFWEQLDGGIQQILNYAQPRRTSQTSSTTQNEDLAGLLAGSTAPAPATDAAGAATGGTAPATPAPAPPPVVPPTDTASASGTTGSSSGSGTGRDGAFYILNRQASVLTVSATDKQHQLIEKFLQKIEQGASAQVLIEAKILEVQLDERYQAGVDWRVFNNRLGLLYRPNATVGATTDGTSIGNPISFIIDRTPEDGQVDSPLGFLARFTEQFGTVRTLSSPRLHAINNQIATLTFARNEVYFELEIERQNNNSGGTSTTTDISVNSSVRTVPIGIIMSLQPSINMETNEVTLSVRPTLSSLVGEKDDPSVTYLAQAAGVEGIRNAVPVVQVRELDSILKLKSGQVMVIGGLMEQGSDNTDRGVPFASSVPYVGNLFKSAEKITRNTELIIFIKATIVGSSGNSAPADRVIYDKFTDDPRPLTF